MDIIRLIHKYEYLQGIILSLNKNAMKISEKKNDSYSE